MKTNKIHSLDLFRGVCGYGVAITHFYAYLYEDIVFEYYSLLFVEWFFVLSGFVLYPQLVKVLNNKKHLKTFYVRRWVRTLPLYGLALFCAAMMTSNLFNADFFKYLVFAQKLLPGFVNDDFYPVAWSLSIEEYFYLVFPLFLLLISKVKFINKVLLLLVGMTVVKIALSDSVDMNFYRTGTLFRLDSILLGFIGAHFKDRIVQYPKLVVIAVVALFSVFLYVQEGMFLGQVDNVGKILFVALLQSISFFLLFGFIMADGKIKNNHLKKFCGFVANQTYSIYLFHLLFLYIIKANFISVEGIFIYYLAALFIVSYAIFEYFEKPLLSLRPRYK
jgi:peptidoglycan/LPS O-acetylase OafA/YrhL